MVLATVPPDPTLLERRPEARPFSIDDLLALLQRGKLRIPPFQRPFRWKPEDRRLLFDSIAHGYPIGTLLLWKRPAEAGRIGFGRFEIDAPDSADAMWVVDGQQRLTTLAEALLVPPQPNHTELLANLDNDKFTFGRRSREKAPAWLPLYEIGDLGRLLEWAHHSRLPDDYREKAFQLAKRIREYQVPAYLVETSDDKVLREIFRRTNTSGRALKEAEVFDVLFGKRSDQSPASLREVASRLEGERFGEIQPDLVLLALLTLRRLDPAGSLDQLGHDTALQAMVETEAALRRAIVFLRRSARIPHLRLLPYTRVLAALALFFHEHPQPQPRSLQLLSRWIWRGAIDGSFQGDVADLRQAILCINRDEEGTVQRLLKAETATKSRETDHLELLRRGELLELRPFNFRYARCKIQVLALVDLDPRHLSSGAPIDVAQLSESLEVPIADLAGGGRTEAEDQGLASRIVHPRLPPKELCRLLRLAETPVLTSHGIPPEAYAPLSQGAFQEVFRLREGFLVQHLLRFLAKRAQWGESDRPTLAWLLRQGDEGD